MFRPAEAVASAEFLVVVIFPHAGLTYDYQCSNGPDRSRMGTATNTLDVRLPSACFNLSSPNDEQLSGGARVQFRVRFLGTEFGEGVQRSRNQ